ncbi:glia-derived nexin [Protopterus annectens]|uniref:glia-derived nexin n=1 Tax=Protopterus annectens TaxID=7888 RepID=UPI001CFB0463|nr:glia-derived nexin [Protopterus annectens]XP_043926186.1 glia-derived nexin [Protopterus annectens]
MRSLILFAVVIVAVSPVYPQSNLSSVAEVFSDIGVQVFGLVTKSKPQENVVLSPYGISSILGMLMLGADGLTKKQLATAMRYNINARSSKVLKKLQKALLTRKNKDIITIANAVFAQAGFKMEKSFVTDNKALFHCDVKSLDFSDTADAAAKVNQWVQNQTRGMIKDLIQPHVLDNVFTRLVVVNSIYFKGLWKSHFQAENTKVRGFTGPDKVTYQVPMMTQLNMFNYGSASTPSGLLYNILELPYHGQMVSMLIVLPVDSSTPLSAIIPHISTKTVQSWMSSLSQRRVQIMIPKFTAESELSLEEPLSALGITDMFQESKANFAKITMSEQLYVSYALQKAKIEVNEDGTKASAATTAVLMARSSPPWFIVDRPFLFCIRHNPTGSILFMGQITKP